ncbi:hypothetical protein CMUS01_04346 [Colletotrichum musicola]|uniref:Uncharacterized protein n=1 Tax=Colletotrichum musicola TaxID=2175873 RepID=A0A8H6KXN7_9PEZI|nr:hypothetical protein CMUS01_04346 [Colletotrichum musicola]
MEDQRRRDGVRRVPDPRGQHLPILTSSLLSSLILHILILIPSASPRKATPDQARPISSPHIRNPAS